MNPPGIGNPKTHIKFYDAFGVSNGEIFVEDKYSMMLNVDDRRLTAHQAFILRRKKTKSFRSWMNCACI